MTVVVTVIAVIVVTVFVALRRESPAS